MGRKFYIVGILIGMTLLLGACANGNAVSTENSNSKLPTESSSIVVLDPSADENTASTGDEDVPPLENDGTPVPENPADETEKDDANSSSNTSILIAYFSWSGNTKQLAELIQEQTGGDLFEIRPETPYTDDINELSGIALQEQQENARPALNGAVENMSQYDIVFVGFPDWWSDMPMPVFTFLEGYDFKGKRIVPFTTYGNSVWGRSLDSIRATLPEATILEGLAVQEHELEQAPTEIDEWLQILGVVKQDGYEE